MQSFISSIIHCGEQSLYPVTLPVLYQKPMASLHTTAIPAKLICFLKMANFILF